MCQSGAAEVYLAGESVWLTLAGQWPNVTGEPRVSLMQLYLDIALLVVW